MGILRTDKISGLETPTAVTGSVYFDGSADTRLTVPHSADFNLGDFTIEWWGRYTSDTESGDAIITKGWDTVYAPFLIQMSGTTSLVFYASGNGSSWNIASAETIHSGIETDVWYHYAVVRNGSSFKAYVDGIETMSFTSSTAFMTNTDELTIGSGDDGHSTSELSGYISNLRILNGNALYTEEFTRPIHPLEVVDHGTVLLCCNSSDSATASTQLNVGAAPPTITSFGNAAASSVSPPLTRDFTFGTEFRGVTTFDTQGYFVPPSGTATERFVDVASNAVSASSARGIFQGGQVPGNTNVIEYITIASAGNGIDFGDRTIARQYLASVASNTRGVTAGGDPSTNVIDYITISTLGDAQDFGDLFTGRYGMGSCASSIRGVWAGGTPGTVNTIDYVTIASTGDAKDFGDLTSGRVYLTGCGSPSRGLFAGGITPTRLNTIDFITIASMGNAFDFGDLTEVVGQRAGCSSSTRGVFGGGSTPTIVNTIDFVTISSTSNATDFGDITVARGGAGACSSSTRGVFGGGDSPAKRNTIDFVVLESLGDATDFGDLTAARKGVAGCSNGHGGLG